MLVIDAGLTSQLLLVGIIAFVTVWWTNQGFHNGLLLLLISGMAFVWMIKSPRLPNLTLDRLVWSMVLLVFFLKWRQGQTRRLPLDWVEYSMLVLLAVIGVSMYVHGTYLGELKSIENAGTEKLKLGAVTRGFLIPFSAYFFARRGIVTWGQVRLFFIGVAIITLYLGITGMAEAGGVRWLVFPRYILDPNVGIHYGHVRGPFVNAAFNGTAMAMALPILAWLALKDRAIVVRWLGWATMAVVIAVMPFVLQRAVWLGAVGALAVTALAGSKQRVLLTGLIVLIAAVGLLVLPDTLAARLDAKINKVSTIEFRIELAKMSWEIIQDHPLMGVGFNQFSTSLAAYGAGEDGAPSHNTVLTLAVEIGLLGILPYLAIFTFLALESIRIYVTRAQYRLIIGVLWGMTIAYGIQLVSGELRYVIYLNALLFAVWAMVLETVRHQSRLERAHITPGVLRQERDGYRVARQAVWA